MALDIYPAIDLKDGKAVRLFKGDMQSAKVYGEALAFAKGFEDMGARFLHIVDLDGAMEGTPRNLDTIESIIKATKLKVQIGGGIRDEGRIQTYMQMGISRVILGSIALKDFEFTKSMAAKYKVAIGIDARDGKVATQGWVNQSDIDAKSLAKNCKDSEIEAIICTDILRDGALVGINIAWSENIAKLSGKYTIASGGFASEEELRALDSSPYINGVIVGKAFYEGKINLGKVLRCFAK